MPPVPTVRPVARPPSVPAPPLAPAAKLPPQQAVAPKPGVGVRPLAAPPAAKIVGGGDPPKRTRTATRDGSKRDQHRAKLPRVSSSPSIEVHEASYDDIDEPTNVIEDVKKPAAGASKPSVARKLPIEPSPVIKVTEAKGPVPRTPALVSVTRTATMQIVDAAFESMLDGSAPPAAPPPPAPPAPSPPPAAPPPAAEPAVAFFSAAAPPAAPAPSPSAPARTASPAPAAAPSSASTPQRTASSVPPASKSVVAATRGSSPPPVAVGGTPTPPATAARSETAAPAVRPETAKPPVQPAAAVSTPPPAPGGLVAQRIVIVSGPGGEARILAADGLASLPPGAIPAIVVPLVATDGEPLARLLKLRGG
jgi:hypothetical protein